MPGTIRDFAAAVENVIGICRDAEQGYRGAAEAVENPILKQRFVELSTERGRYAAELQQAVRAMGFDATNPAGLGGTLFGGWMQLKGLVTGHKAHAILEETERGEDLTLKTYRQAVAISLPAELRTLIETQYEQVQKDHAEIRALRDQSGTGGLTPATKPQL